MSANQHNDITIAIAGHKQYWLPDDSMFLPIQAGAAGKAPLEGWLRDDQGDNISEVNSRYCELTVLYWAWKHIRSDYLGLAHYRRHFAGSGDRGVITCDEVRALLEKAPVVLPRKRHYVVETVGDHYAHTFDQSHLDALRKALAEESPETLPFYERHLGARSAHIWNMFIMRRDLADAYCEWLFPVLYAAEQRIDYTGMTPFEERVVGRVSERLLDPWLAQHDVPFVEVPVVSLEGENLAKKAAGVLQAKFFGKKYTQSF